MHEGDFSTQDEVKLPCVVSLPQNVLIQGKALLCQNECEVAQELQREQAQDIDRLKDPPIGI